MSRSGGSDYDEAWPNQGAFWWANAQRALTGKRGRKVLAELREALLMLPERRLVSGAVSTASLAARADEMPDTWPTTSFENYVKHEMAGKCVEEGIGVCAVGAYLLRKRVLELGETPDEAMKALPSASDIEGYGIQETADLGARAGMTRGLAWLLADQNDETYGACTPEERYEKFLAWIDQELAVTP
jgi:hypothetical protein